jgi:two-component system response regulator (stage 0 sporulation protein F)
MSDERKPAVLIVDDEESICLLYQAELEDRGYVVQIQTDGNRVLQDIQSFHPRLVVLDIKMPQIDGLELLGRIKAKFPEVLVVMNSAYGSFQNEEAVRHADGFVVKSSDLTELLQTIENVLP